MTRTNSCRCKVRREISKTIKRYIFKHFASGNNLTLAQRGRVAASYLVVESLKASGAGKLAKTAFLVPFDSFRRAISGSFNAQLQKAIPTGVDDYFVDDVASLTASQLNEVLEDGIIKLAPRPTDGLINKYLSNFLNDNSY